MTIFPVQREYATKLSSVVSRPGNGPRSTGHFRALFLFKSKISSNSVWPFYDLALDFAKSKSLVLKALEQNLLQPFMGGARRQRGQRISLYADDVVLFLQPQPAELSLVKVILRVFGEAFGLVTNFSKCSFTPITCGGQEIQSVQQLFPCSMVQFPCKYLGLPLSPKAAQGCLLFTH
jgi:hypothetical protein